MHTTEAIIFDCFGVLVTDALQVIHDELKAKEPAAADEISGLVRASNRGVLDPAESNQQIADILGISFDAYQNRIKEGEVKNEQLLAYIRQLHTTYKTAVLSNISATGLAKRFTDEELADAFDAVVSSGEIGYAKPEARAYEIVAERLGVRADACVFVDDREGFCEAARAVGMRTIWYQNFDQFKTDIEELLKQG